MKKLIKQNKRLILILLIPYLFIVCSGFVSIRYETTSPGELNKVEDVITIEQSNTEKGSFNTISVYSVEKISFLTFLIAKLDNLSSVNKMSNYINQTNAQMYSSGNIQKNVSIINAIILAYRKAGKTIVTNYNGRIIHTVYDQLSSSFNIGDYLIKYNDEDITENFDLNTQIINDVKANKQIMMTVNRKGSLMEVEYEPAWVNDKKDSFYIGLYYYNSYSIDSSKTSPRYVINSTNTLGPSGGLMQALSVYNAITEEDLTKGLKIAGTGTIDVDGKVGEIGGIYQKVMTAYASKADVFFVPVDRDSNGDLIIDDGTNYSEAYKAYQVIGCPEEMAFVPISTFDEAVEWLKNYKVN